MPFRSTRNLTEVSCWKLALWPQTQVLKLDRVQRASSEHPGQGGSLAARRASCFGVFWGPC